MTGASTACGARDGSHSTTRTEAYDVCDHALAGLRLQGPARPHLAQVTSFADGQCLRLGEAHLKGIAQGCGE